MKLCGCKEKCFENGKCWGHFEGIMCENLGETEINGEHKSICSTTNEEVLVYTTDMDYKKVSVIKL